MTDYTKYWMIMTVNRIEFMQIGRFKMKDCHFYISSLRIFRMVEVELW